MIMTRSTASGILGVSCGRTRRRKIVAGSPSPSRQLTVPQSLLVVADQVIE
jgi:hypothetical protein